MNGFFRVYPYVGEGAGSVTVVEVLQCDNPRGAELQAEEVPVAFVSRYLTTTESKASHIMALTSTVHWAVRRCTCFLSFAHRLEVVVPRAEYVVAMRGISDNLRLQALQVDLAAFAPRWIVGECRWIDPSLEAAV